MRTAKPKSPPKPYPTFPLFAHQNGSWTKKIGGEHVRFGPWRWPDADAYQTSWQEALANYESHLEQIARGRVVLHQPRLTTIRTLADMFLGPQHERAERGEIKPRSFAELRSIIVEFRDHVGVNTTIGELERDPEPIREFVAGIGRRYGWCAFNKRIKLVRSMWHWSAAEHGPLSGRPFAWMSLFAERPIKEFRRQRRREREEGVAVTFAPDEVRALIDAAPQPLKAMVLLGYFCGYGNTDLGELPDTAMKVSAEPQRLFIRGREEIIPAGWGTIYFPRPKTELDRYAMIPPGVVEIVRAARAMRPRPRSAAWKNRMFLTAGGRRVCYEVVRRDPAGLIEKVEVTDNVGQPWRRLVQRIGRCPTHEWQVRIPFSRERDDEGRPVRRCPRCKAELIPMQMHGFYDLRHTATTFAAVSGASDDTRKIFEGHVDRANPTRQTYYLDPTQLHDLHLIARELLARLGLTETAWMSSADAAADTATTAS